jgi:hypothetical protein
VKLTFESKDGSTVTAEADDADMLVGEIQQGAQDFVMLRYKPGTLKVNVPDGTAKHMRFDGSPS